MTARRLLLLVTTTIALLVVSVAPASAHATLVRTEPADASVLDEAPTSVELSFNEAVSVESSTVEFIDVEGSSYDAEIVGHGANDSTLVVQLAEVPDGLYSLRWSAFSTSDGHLTRGMLVWGFGDGADLSEASFPTISRPVPPIEVMLRWMLFAGLALVIGGMVVEGLVLRPLRSRFAADSEESWHWTAATRTVFWVRRGARLSMAAGALLIVRQLWVVGSSTDQSIVDLVESSLLSTAWGQWAIIRLAAVVGIAIVVCCGHRVSASGGLIYSLAGIALVAQASGGHAAGTDDALFSIANDVVHLGASVAWLGAVFVLWRVLSVGGSRRPKHIASEALSAFSPFAMTAVAAAVVTGLLAVGGQVTSIDAFIGSLYGRAFLVKFFAIGVVLLLALSTRRAMSRDVSEQQTGGEAITGVLLLGVVALITASVPANGVTWLPNVKAETQQLAIVQDNIQLGLSVTPNVPGQNLVLVDAATTRRMIQADVDRLLVRITPNDLEVEPSTIEAELTERTGEYQVATTLFAAAGSYEVEIVVRRIGQPDVTTEFMWTVASAPDARGVVVSDGEIEGWTSLVGLLGAALLVGIVIWWGTTARARDRRMRDLESFLVDDSTNRRRVDP